jgi:hypothetical protein
MSSEESEGSEFSFSDTDTGLPRPPANITRPLTRRQLSFSDEDSTPYQMPVTRYQPSENTSFSMLECLYITDPVELERTMEDIRRAGYHERIPHLWRMVEEHYQNLRSQQNEHGFHPVQGRAGDIPAPNISLDQIKQNMTPILRSVIFEGKPLDLARTIANRTKRGQVIGLLDQLSDKDFLMLFRDCNEISERRPRGAKKKSKKRTKKLISKKNKSKKRTKKRTKKQTKKRKSTK